jgi:hypothetical protein
MVVLCGVALVAQTRTPGDTLQLWEYRTEVTRERAVAVEPRRESAIDGMLNTRGSEGWELVGVTRRDVRIDDTIQTETLYAFKRPTRSVNR